MPKKKQPRNSFYFYMLDQQQIYQQRGEYYNMKQMADIAGPKWRQLSIEEKRYYEDMAKDEKGRHRKAGILDSYGNSVEENLRQEQELVAEEKEMENYIELNIKYLGDKEDVANEPFFFVSTKIFCCTDEGEYLPAEIGLVEYTLADGITKQYHRFIDPGTIPLGYSFACKETSERTHKIPTQNFELADSDYTLITFKIKDLLNSENTQSSYPILYCSREEMDQTKYILRWLQMKSGVRNPIKFRVYDAAVLMCKLYHFCSTQMCSVSLVRDYLSSSHFTYSANTCCEWHWNEDSPEHCALGTVKRIGFIFSDHLCENFNITPLPNKHLPEREPDEQPELPPPLPKADRRPPSSASKMSLPSLDREMATIVKNIKSRFNLEEDKYYVPSACAVGETSKEAAVAKKPVQKTLQPLREPKAHNLSFSEAAYPFAVKPQFSLDANEFPRLNDLDDKRSESSLSLSSFGARSSFSKSSVSTFSIPNSSWVRAPSVLPSQRPPFAMQAPTAGLFQRPPGMMPPAALQLEKMPQVGQPNTQNALPIGRGIGRGLAVQK